MADTLPIAFWLLPGGPDAERLQGLVGRLAREHGGPVFEPHITLHVAACPPDTDIDAVLAQVAAASPPHLRLAALATGNSDAYYQALFAGIATDRRDGEGLLTLRRRLVAKFEAAYAPQEPEPSAAYVFHPHLSLLYGELPPALREQLVGLHDLRGQTILFDRIAAVAPAAQHRDLARVERWHVFGHRPLGSPASGRLHS